MQVYKFIKCAPYSPCLMISLSVFSYLYRAKYIMLNLFRSKSWKHQVMICHWFITEILGVWMPKYFHCDSVHSRCLKRQSLQVSFDKTLQELAIYIQTALMHSRSYNAYLETHYALLMRLIGLHCKIFGSSRLVYFFCIEFRRCSTPMHQSWCTDLQH